MNQSKFSKEELENSKRIFKSATPKYTADWYIKWIASAFVLAAMSIRGIAEYQPVSYTHLTLPTTSTV